MDRFIYEAAPARVIFGAGMLATLGDELDRLGFKRALVLSTPEQRELAQRVHDSLDTRAVGLFDGAVMHVPVEVAKAAGQVADSLQADCTVAIGGGSTIGLGKAIALRSKRPVIAVPTTFAGSEMTAVWGLTENGVKTTGRDAAVLPRAVIYDSILLASLPTAMAGVSGMNAIAHCVEALYAIDANPVISLFAEQGIVALAEALPQLAEGKPLLRPGALARAQYGCWMAGMSLNGTSMALHHKLCHTLGGSLNLPHAQTHTVILPYATAYNANAAPEAMHRIALALGPFGRQGAARGLHELARAIGAPTSLAELGVARAALPKVAELATRAPYPNPRAVERDAILALLEQALTGEPPAADPLDD
ncbi:MAG: maleylacetate reductase [Burkholderiaceae bacterium]